jgi:uncharacterized phage protein (TIGR01671 family)
MTRIIKFRAWTGKNMIDDIRLESAHGIRLISSSDLAPHDMSDDKVVLEQSTGLFDRTGREIYEGDIIKDETEHGSITKVVWNAAGFEIHCSLDERLQRQEGIRFGYWVAEAMAKVEVIGNIHQNKKHV